MRRGPDHYTVGLASGNLARALMALPRFEESERLLERALAIDERVLGPDHLSVVVDLHNSRPSSARWESTRSPKRSSCGRSRPRRRPSVAALRGSVPRFGLGVLRFDEGRYEEAEALYRSGLAVREQTLPFAIAYSGTPTHPESRARVVGLGVVSASALALHLAAFPWSRYSTTAAPLS